ncbi:MAG: L-cystine uptake protein TcyP (sodium:dicarboxylate symporter family) [Woeseiaceae bacterium]|jgi:L-cystine uptake protein TcyP (sodium:dicarboxylate symporter family)|tara:strand:- start:3918 stop:5291 length:1374 start_codon:yes stop_codon:yes gene_type:complete
MFAVIFNIFVFALLILFIARQMKSGITLSKQILLGLFFGIFFGLALQFLYVDRNEIIQDTLIWTNVIGSSYVNLLRMVIMPLVLTMMIAAVVKMRDIASLGKVGFSVVFILLGTTMIAALVGAGISNLFGLSMDGLTEGARELSRADSLISRQESIASLGLADMLVRFIPSNIFSDLTGARPTSVIAVVIFGILFGIAALMVAKEDQEKATSIVSFIETTQAIIMKLVRMIMLLTPYGILALMTKVVAGSNASDIFDLINFVLASYVAIALMFVIHALILRMNGVNVLQYFKDIWPVLTFAFTSRSSAATIPLNVETQVDKLHVPQSIANLSATLGSTIGQNGCAGIYPAMLAAMIAPSMGVNPMDPMFILSLVMIVTISSFGIAGVGGGATFAALVVLPAMGFPVALVALLISIEPLIDMARTALNVNGSMMAGVITGRILKIEETNSELTEAKSI